MIKQSDLALAAWKATERTLDAVVTINKIDYKTTDIASISYDAGGYTGDTFGIGSNYENSVTIKFSHLIEGLKPGMTVWPKIGIKTSNGYEYSSLGLFIVSDDIQMDRNNDETTIKAYDQMCLLEGTYTSKLTYPAKMTSVIAEIANLAGVLLNTTDINRLPVQVNLPSAITGQTYRNAIGMIAQFYAGFATFDRDGKLTIHTITEPDYTLDPSQYEQGGLTKNEAPYKIGGIQCEVTTTTTDSTGQSTETTNTLQVGAASGSQIKLTNNLMTMDRLASIWQQLQSLTFYPFSLNWFGNPAIEAGDWLTLQDTKGNKFNVPNNGYTMTFDGSLSAVSKADQTSTSSSSYAWRGELSQYVADLGGRQGASGNYIYGTDTIEPPYGAKFNDIWYKQNGNKIELWTYERQADGTGKWVLTVSDSTGEEVKAKVDQVELEAKASTDAAKAASDKADQLSAKYDDTNALANQALGQAVSAQSAASSAVAAANSTASEFGKVDQKADNAVASALNAQSAASDAVATANSTASGFGRVEGKADSALSSALDAQSDANTAVSQASSAASDSKDAKQIAGAVSQSYKTLTDGSTMTIAELQNGLAAKLTKSDLDGYATETWAQNQIKMTADGINGTMSSIKSTVDSQTTSINDLKADSSSFKSQFTTVNDTLGKQTTDIGSLQASSKELSSNFNSLSTDNDTNKHDISELKQTATEVSSTLETVQTQVQNSAVGTNLIIQSDLKYGYLDPITGDANSTSIDFYSDNYIPTNGATVFTFSSPDYVFKGSLSDRISMYDSNKNYLGYQLITSPTQTLSQSNVAYIRFCINSADEGNTTGNASDWLDTHRYKLEKGSKATDYSINPEDTAKVTAFSKLSQTVDGMKTDISKKIERTDLNGYATETWAQNQINATADGINGTMSSVKSTVDSHTTSINNLQADSNSFKSQFTTVNDTLGKQTTDIGSLQASSKELTTGFNTLTSDNTTNKNDISQLKQTATEVSSTLETVQTQIDNSAVGINLLIGTSNQVVQATDWNLQVADIKYGKSLGKNLCASVMINNANHDLTQGTARIYLETLDASGNILARVDGNDISYNANGLSQCSISINDSTADIKAYIFTVGMNGNAFYSCLKIEKGTKATDWCLNPTETATVTAVSKLSQTVDGMKSDISKKIEQKDLNGYATETWAQNKINATADGINSTLSSVKKTVDGHSTSINDLKADSNSFKSQFTTVNNTIGKHTTDIGTLQASAKSLSSNFDSLNTDNSTNKHDISQLQQTAEKFNSTLMTVQTQVQDSAVGTNLLQGTRDFSGNAYQSLNKVAVTNGQGQFQAVTGTNPSATDYDIAMFTNLPLEKDTNYTSSFWVKTSENIDIKSFLFDSGSNGNYYDGATINQSTTDYTRVVVHFHNGNNNATLNFIPVRINKKDVTVWLYGLKLEKGDLATDWCPNPADNATVTAFSELSQTVDGMKSDISKKIEQSDLNGYATQTWAQNQIKTTADGINGTLSSVKTTVDGHDTSINELKADSSSFKTQFTTVNGTLEKQSTDIGTLQASSKSLSASFNSLSSDNQTNQHNISQLQASAETFNSTLMTVQQQVTNSAVGTNLLLNTGDLSTNWLVTGTVDISQNPAVLHYPMTTLTSSANTIANQQLKDGLLQPSTTYTASFYAKGTGTFMFFCFPDVSNGALTAPDNATLIKLTGDYKRYTITFITLPNISGEKGLLLRQDYSASNPDQNTVEAYVYGFKLEKGSIATDWCRNPADNATVTALSSISQTIEHIQTTVSSKVDNETYQSQINQLSGQINLRVEKDGVINAINVSTDGTQIYGDKLHITATTFIDDAIIKDAMIESIKADKIKVGTLDATKVNIIHLNANNITAGTIRGANLTIGLDNGDVEFQHGRIHSADNTIDININSKYISVANDVNRVMLKNGELQFVEPSILDTEDSPYLRIHNRGGAIYGGTEIIARDYVSLSNAANSNDFYADDMGLQKFSGLFTGYDRISKKWRPTVVGGAERGVIITGGSLSTSTSISPIKSSPRIVVGYDNGNNFTGGNRILLDAAFVHSFSTYSKTSSQSPNVYVSTDGALLRSTSASKYKTNIVRGRSSEYGKKLINLPIATWIDKASVERYSDDPSQPVPGLNYGMIAEDLADAGLEKLVVRNDEGGLEGIQYDRIAVALLPLLAEWKQIIDNQEKEINELKNKKEQ